jgi:hypothetical protein
MYVFFLCKKPTHPLHQSPSDLGEEAKKGVKDDQYVDKDVHLRSDQQDPEPESRVLHRLNKAHSMVLADSR